MTLEKKITALEKMLTDLESEEVQLDTAIEKYTEAMTLAKDTFSVLNTVQKQFSVLKKEAEQLILSQETYAEE